MLLMSQSKNDHKNILRNSNSSNFILFWERAKMRLAVAEFCNLQEYRFLRHYQTNFLWQSLARKKELQKKRQKYEIYKEKKSLTRVFGRDMIRSSIEFVIFAN